jgi:hypothetical protein
MRKSFGSFASLMTLAVFRWRLSAPVQNSSKGMLPNRSTQNQPVLSLKGFP